MPLKIKKSAVIILERSDPAEAERRWRRIFLPIFFYFSFYFQSAKIFITAAIIFMSGPIIPPPFSLALGRYYFGAGDVYFLRHFSFAILFARRVFIFALRFAPVASLSKITMRLTVPS